MGYRSAQECPDGASFLRALQARALQARIASAGDAVAFVVTIGMQAGGSRGVLERQTRGGTVAIRQLDGDDCEQVADALALTLALAAGENCPCTPRQALTDLRAAWLVAILHDAGLPSGFP